MNEEAGRAGGLLDSVRNLARSILAIVRTRLEIAGTELEERGVLLGRIALLGVVSVACVWLAANLVVFFVIVLFWDTHRLLAIGVLALLFFAVGLLAYSKLRAAFAGRPKLFAATLAELDKDLTELRHR